MSGEDEVALAFFLAGEDCAFERVGDGVVDVEGAAGLDLGGALVTTLHRVLEGRNWREDI